MESAATVVAREHDQLQPERVEITDRLGVLDEHACLRAASDADHDRDGRPAAPGHYPQQLPDLPVGFAPAGADRNLSLQCSLQK